ILMAPVDPTRPEQLFRTNGTERFTQLVADEILTAVATGEREIRRHDLAAAREPRDKLRVLVGGMRGDHEDACVDAEAANELPERGGAGLLRRRTRRENECRGQRRDESASNHASKSTRGRQSLQRAAFGR